MTMFPKRIEWTPIGLLSSEGKSSVWEGHLQIAPFEEAFTVRINGEQTGPTEFQREALKSLIHNTGQIQADATDEMILLLQSANIVPRDVSINPKNLWEFLSPGFIEVHPPTYLSADNIGIAVGFSVPWDEDHLLQIGTINGKFHDVYAE